MPRKKITSMTDDELRKALGIILNLIVGDIKKNVASKKEISEFTSLVVSRFERIDRHVIELREEIRNLRVMYEFWAERHLSPDLIEDYLSMRQKLKKQDLKRVD